MTYHIWPSFANLLDAPATYVTTSPSSIQYIDINEMIRESKRLAEEKAEGDRQMTAEIERQFGPGVKWEWSRAEGEIAVTIWTALEEITVMRSGRVIRRPRWLPDVPRVAEPMSPAEAGEGAYGSFQGPPGEA